MTGPARLPVPEAFVQAWATAIHGACFVPMSRAERCDLLRGLAGRLVAALRTEPFEPADGYRVGAALVAADYTAAEVLARTVTVLHSRLLSDFGLTGYRMHARLPAVVETVVAGFTRAVRDQTLGEQEEIRRAATITRAQAEQALRESQARFRHAALHDPLTGLPNQTYFTDRLRQLRDELPAAARLGVCCIDLDRFEAISDSLGPPVGDQLLIAVAGRLRGLAAEADQLVVRRNGDQFAILVEDTTCAEDATKVADRVLTVLREPFVIDGLELPITASAGVVEGSVAGRGPTDLMRAADVALHWAKADGRDRWRLFDEARSDRDAARYRLSAAMPGAMQRGEFGLRYQPLVDLATGRIAGVEALARWHHPVHGVLGPDRFVDQAEDTGLIVALGMRLLEQACRQAAHWPGLTSHPPYVSVNVSARQLGQPGLVGEIAEVLDRTGLPPHRLQLEITESTVVVTDDETLGQLEALAALGIRFAIDDFGTGYSNLAYLRKLPVCELKVAGSFVAGLPGGPADAGTTDERILATLVALAHTLGLTVTAEGVETAAQAQRLRAIGCDAAQGWHFGPPTAHDQLTGLLAA